MRELYRRFVEARRETGEERAAPAFESFVRGIQHQASRLRNERGCAEIELRVVVRDRRVQLKARPAR